MATNGHETQLDPESFGTIREIAARKKIPEKNLRKAVKRGELPLFYGGTQRGRLYAPHVVEWMLGQSESAIAAQVAERVDQAVRRETSLVAG